MIVESGAFRIQIRQNNEIKIESLDPDVRLVCLRIPALMHQMISKMAENAEISIEEELLRFHSNAVFVHWCKYHRHKAPGYKQAFGSIGHPRARGVQ